MPYATAPRLWCRSRRMPSFSIDDGNRSCGQRPAMYGHSAYSPRTSPDVAVAQQPHAGGERQIPAAALTGDDDAVRVDAELRAACSTVQRTPATQSFSPAGNGSTSGADDGVRQLRKSIIATATSLMGDARGPTSGTSPSKHDTGLHAAAVEVHDARDDVVAVGTDELHLDEVAVRRRHELSGLDSQTVERRNVHGVETCVEVLELGRHRHGRLRIGDLDQSLAAVDVVHRARRNVAQGPLDPRVETVIVLHVGMRRWARLGRHGRSLARRGRVCRPEPRCRGADRRCRDPGSLNRRAPRRGSRHAPASPPV